MPLPMPFASERNIATPMNHCTLRRKVVGEREHEMAEPEADHRRHGAPEAAEAVHDLAAGVEQGEVDGAGDADDEGGVALGDADATPPTAAGSPAGSPAARR